MGGRKVIIIDEADYLNPNSTQPALRGAIEEFSGNCSFIFTCNFKNRIIDPIHSRCSVIDFKINGSKPKMAAQFFKRVEWILEQEGITYDKSVVAAVITKHFPDNRRVLNELQRYAVSGTIDKGILSNVADIQLDDLFKALKSKDFASTRKWVTSNLDNDPVKIYRKLYDGLYDELTPNSVPQLVLILAKYQYQAAFVADHEINMVACLTEIMVDCEFK
jgi:DNA polymerase III delta prime subunit